MLFFEKKCVLNGVFTLFFVFLWCNPCTMNRQFAFIIEKWYEQNKRDLPWRATRNPYHIWISEIILQQTRVAQGLDYFLRFTTRFPNVFSLASASDDEVMRYWQGLGYYSRARNLHEAARSIAEKGEFPKDYPSVLQLKGVGEYTAAAICSIAYGLPHAVVDGNVYRVLSRYFCIDTPIDSTKGKKDFNWLAHEMLDHQNPGRYNQAIMDFGATQCVPHSPDCSKCPLMDSCEAFNTGKVALLPCKDKVTKVRQRYFTYLYMRDPEGKVLLQRRGAGDIWQGLYQFPLYESAEPLTIKDVEALCPEARLTLVVKGVTHQLSHQLLHADCYLAEVDLLNAENGIVVQEKELHNYAFPRLLDKMLHLFRKNK